MSVRPSVVHVHVQIAAEPAFGSEIGDALERRVDIDRGAALNRHRAAERAVLGAADNLQHHITGRHREFGASVGVKVFVFERPLRAIEPVIGVPSRVVG